MTLQELSSHIDIDIAGSLARFSNYEPMYVKYLKRFNTEPTYDDFVAAVNSADFGKLEVTAHTMKGIAGNLGLTALFNDFNDIVGAVRSGKNDDALSISRNVFSKVDDVRKAIAGLD